MKRKWVAGWCWLCCFKGYHRGHEFVAAWGRNYVGPWTRGTTGRTKRFWTASSAIHILNQGSGCELCSCRASPVPLHDTKRTWWLKEFRLLLLLLLDQDPVSEEGFPRLFKSWKWCCSKVSNVAHSVPVFASLHSFQPRMKYLAQLSKLWGGDRQGSRHSSKQNSISCF